MSSSALAVSSPSHLFASLSQRDRRLLMACLAMVAVLIVVVALIAPQEEDGDTTPSSYSSESHGAKAAYLTLAQSGYHIERWERPLDQLAGESDAHTVLIVAEPKFEDTAAAKQAIATILERGGRVLTTGLAGAALLPRSQAAQNPLAFQGECKAQPEGFGPIADSGVINIRPSALWKIRLPEQRAQYTCNGNVVVVSYLSGKGIAIWWADSLPLENAGIARDGNISLLLRSIGSSENSRIIWDEGLHEDARGLWSYAEGTPVHLLWAQLALVGFLLVFSYGRRSGPLLPDPVVARDVQLEFVHSLGALYDKAGATNTAVRVAYDRFRLMLGRHAGTPQAGSSSSERAQEIVSLVNARLGHTSPDLQAEIQDCEEVAYTADPIPPRRALSLVRSLWQYEDEMQQGRKKTQKKEETSGRTELTD
jgi:hypothetical protein